MGTSQASNFSYINKTTFCQVVVLIHGKIQFPVCHRSNDTVLSAYRAV